MGKRVASEAHLDTHIALWLYDALIEKLSPAQVSLIENSRLFISEFARLELHYLYETGRISVKPAVILPHLTAHAEVTVSSCPLNIIMDEAVKMRWTRDPFDRLITANALAEKAILLTRDETILAHCRSAVG